LIPAPPTAPAGFDGASPASPAAPALPAAFDCFGPGVTAVDGACPSSPAVLMFCIFFFAFRVVPAAPADYVRAFLVVPSALHALLDDDFVVVSSENHIENKKMTNQKQIININQYYLTKNNID